MVGAGVLVAFLSGHVSLDVHGFGLITFTQSGWLIWLGILMCRRIPAALGIFLGSSSYSPLIVSCARATHQSNHDPQKDNDRQIYTRKIESPVVAGQVPNAGVVNVKKRM